MTQSSWSVGGTPPLRSVGLQEPSVHHVFTTRTRGLLAMVSNVFLGCFFR